MAKPTTREQFKDNCLRRLGWPVIDINIDDDQVEDRIDEALSHFQQFHTDGTAKTYLKHQITQEDKDNQYIVISEDIIGIKNIWPFSGGSNQTMNMFDLRYQLRLNDLYDLRSAQFTNYVMTMQQLRMIEMLFTGEIPIRFNQHTNRLYIDWDWSNDAVVGQWIVCESYVIVDPETYTDVWSDWWLQNYATALIKRQWGNNMKKFEGVKLPGGITMNGQQIFNEAIQELAELENTLRDTYENRVEAMLIG